MILRIKYFGQLSDICNKTEELYSTNVETVEELENELITIYPNMKSIQYKIAVNGAFASSTEPIHENNEIAFLPPFAGG